MAFQSLSQPDVDYRIIEAAKIAFLRNEGTDHIVARCARCGITITRGQAFAALRIVCDEIEAA